MPEGRLAPIRTPIGSAPENATMQLLHQTCRSRIARLNAAGVIGGSSGTYGAQQRFSASTSSPMSSLRQNLYAGIKDRGASPRRTPLHARSRGPHDPRSARVAHSLRSFARTSGTEGPA